MKPLLTNIIMMAMAAMTISACASVASGTDQTLLLSTNCKGAAEPGAQCTLSNSKGEWEATTPSKVPIKKSFGKLTVTCTKDDRKVEETFKSGSEGSFWGNIIIGGGIGMLVDAGSGAGFSYQDTLALDLPPPCDNR